MHKKNFLGVSNILKKSSLDKTNHQSKKKDHLKKNGKRETDKKNLFERLRQNENSVLYGSDNVTNTLIKKLKKEQIKNTRYILLCISSQLKNH